MNLHPSLLPPKGKMTAADLHGQAVALQHKAMQRHSARERKQWLAEAVRLLRCALKLDPKHGKSLSMLGTALQNGYGEPIDRPQALQLFESAVDAAAADGDPDPLASAANLNNLGLLRLELAQTDPKRREARSTLERAVSAYPRRTSFANAEEVATMMSNLVRLSMSSHVLSFTFFPAVLKAMAHRVLNEPAEALKLHNAALEGLASTHTAGASAVSVVRCLNDMALCYRDLADLPKAMAHTQKALDKAPPAEVPRLLLNLASLHLANGEPEHAFPHRMEAFRLCNEHEAAFPVDGIRAVWSLACHYLEVFREGQPALELMHRLALNPSVMQGRAGGILDPCDLEAAMGEAHELIRRASIRKFRRRWEASDAKTKPKPKKGSRGGKGGVEGTAGGGMEASWSIHLPRRLLHTGEPVMLAHLHASKHNSRQGTVGEYLPDTTGKGQSGCYTVCFLDGATLRVAPSKLEVCYPLPMEEMVTEMAGGIKRDKQLVVGEGPGAWGHLQAGARRGAGSRLGVY